MGIKVCDQTLRTFLDARDLAYLEEAAAGAHKLLVGKNGAGSDFLGWLSYPETYDRAEYARVQEAARRIRETSDVLIVIGIGGSYLGALSAIELLRGRFHNLKADGLQVFFAGNNLSASYLNELLALCEGREVSVNVISKSGTTTEPAIAFRIFKQYLEQRYGRAEAAQRIYVTTDRKKGTLKALADAEGYETFVVPDDIGGRYSVLTSVGMLPIAAAGCDTGAILSGAGDAMRELAAPGLANPAYHYAALRNALYRKGKTTEILVGYEPDLVSFQEWWKQLFGESEGKDGKGIFPASVCFSTDLHSMGQYIQQGLRNLFETVLFFRQPKQEYIIPCDDANADGLSFLDRMPVSRVNHRAFEAALLAHTDGGVPNIVLEAERIDAYTYGYLVYFFEKACAASGYMLGVNPFNQPGVEDYKVNMFALLGKPGYAENRTQLESRLWR